MVCDVQALRARGIQTECVLPAEIYVATKVTITTLIILTTGPKREYPDGGGVNWGSTINKGHTLNGLRTFIHD